MAGDDYRARLIAARHKLGLTPREMAERLLTPRQTYEQWESGRNRTPGTAVVAAEGLRAVKEKAEDRAHETKTRKHTERYRRRQIRPGTKHEELAELADGSRTARELAEALDITLRNLKTRLKDLRKRGIACPVKRTPPGPVAGSEKARETTRRASAVRWGKEIE